MLSCRHEKIVADAFMRNWVKPGVTTHPLARSSFRQVVMLIDADIGGAVAGFFQGLCHFIREV